MSPYVQVVDDRTFAIGLCELFRDQMIPFEERMLLPLAERACGELGLAPADVPVEGYYAGSDQLKRLFRLVRALQRTDKSRAPMLAGPLAELRRIYASPAFGRLAPGGGQLPQMASAFSESLLAVERWSVPAIADMARRLVRDSDCDLMAAACLTGDPVAICAARETVALTSLLVFAEPGVPAVSWRVSDAVAAAGQRFIDALARCTGIVLAPSGPESALRYAEAAKGANLDGRCILVGDQVDLPFPLYHWYIGRASDAGVADFWSSAIWTTADLRQIPHQLRPGPGAQVGAPAAAEAETTAPPHGWLSRFGKRLLGR